MKSRYCYCPMTAKRIGRRMTLADLFHRWQRIRRDRRNAPELFPVGNYYTPVYPSK